MSLKAFHIVFITLSSLQAFGFGIWSLHHVHAEGGTGLDLALGIGSLILGVALIIYGVFFLKKLKDTSLL